MKPVSRIVSHQPQELIKHITAMPLQDILARHIDLGKSVYYHEILVKGSDFEACKNKVLHFFEKYQLVRYSQINILETQSLSASSPDFEGRLKSAISKNHQILHDLIKILRGEGIITLNDLQDLPQGYKSKMLHVITHFLDGFFGIDTFFYNLEDDSHWVIEEFKEKIKAEPSRYWIINIEARI